MTDTDQPGEREYDRLLSDRPLELFFNAGDFTLKTSGMPLSVIDFDCARDTVAVLLHPFIALLYHRKHFFPLPF
jgi:hypothetical protein